jgi:PAS domain-containing protein
LAEVVLDHDRGARVVSPRRICGCSPLTSPSETPNGPRDLCEKYAGETTGADIVLHVEAAQKPIELILARSFISSLSTPAFLVDEGGILIFYNESAGSLLGRRFEEIGKVGPERWGTMFGPFDESGAPIPYDELPLVLAVRQGRPAHARFSIRSMDGVEHAIEASAVPILTPQGSRGGIAFFWAVEDAATVGE